MDRDNSADSLDEHKVRVDMTDTTDTEVEDDYKKKRREGGMFIFVSILKLISSK